MCVCAKSEYWRGGPRAFRGLTVHRDDGCDGGAREKFPYCLNSDSPLSITGLITSARLLLSARPVRPFSYSRRRLRNARAFIRPSVMIIHYNNNNNYVNNNNFNYVNRIRLINNVGLCFDSQGSRVPAELEQHQPFQLQGT